MVYGWCWWYPYDSIAHWADLGVQVAWIHYLASIHVNLYPLAAQSAVLGYWEAGRWFGRDAVIPMIILPTPNYYCFITFGKRMSNLQSRYNRDCEYLICCHISSRPPPLSSLTSVVRPAGLEYSWLSGAASCNTIISPALWSARDRTSSSQTQLATSFQIYKVL